MDRVLHKHELTHLHTGSEPTDTKPRVYKLIMEYMGTTGINEKDYKIELNIQYRPQRKMTVIAATYTTENGDTGFNRLLNCSMRYACAFAQKQLKKPWVAVKLMALNHV